MTNTETVKREWELEGRTHRTEDDAVAQVVHHGKMGAHVAATETYLVKLRAELIKWQAEVDAELAKRDHDRARRMAECICEDLGGNGPNTCPVHP